MTLEQLFKRNDFRNFVLRTGRAGCLLVYGFGAAGALKLLPPPWSFPAEALALFVLASHTLELLYFARRLSLHPGPLAESAALAILFGSLHWFPLLHAAKRRQAPSSAAKRDSAG